MRRKYPYFKQRQWSKPYMCTQFSQVAPVGHSMRLAVSYVPWEGAEVYYELRRTLEAALPGAQILGDANADLVEKEDAVLCVRRLNDSRELLRIHKGEKLSEAVTPETLERLTTAALDNFHWRYGYGEDGAVEHGIDESSRVEEDGLASKTTTAAAGAT
mmetsp:Transcript_38460/g.80551  ORF Transcript_38460/g.80551 Transcript_38460/m.80551 type:complete len:159 (+) Transcript_38460:3-479(+)